MFPLSFYLYTIETEEDRRKLEVIYEEYLASMSRVARAYVGKYQAEEDVVHNAIMKLIDNLHKIDLNDKEATWSYVRKTTYSSAIDWLKHEKKFIAEDIDELDSVVESDDPLPLERVMSKDGYRYLVQCIRSLKDTYRDACELKFLCGKKEREIAQILCISEKNAGIRIVRGRQALIEMLKEDRKDD